MDREQEELQFLGVFGIIKESFKIIFSWRKIFSQITLAFILPQSIIFLIHFIVSQILFFKIVLYKIELSYTKMNTPMYSRLSDLISSELIFFLLFKAAYFTFLLVFSLLSTSAIVYTIACIYTSKEITFKKVMSIVPKVWKRLIVTFLCSFFVVLVYNIILVILILLWSVFIGLTSFGIFILVVLLVLYLIGLVYIGLIWQLASVISVLENFYGIQAMIKSKALMKGKMGLAIALSFIIGLCFLGIQALFENLVVVGFVGGLLVRVGVGILCLLLLFKVILFGLVIHTVFYFVCKSYHHENIDKYFLAEHLECYLGEYVPLKDQDVQLEEFHF